MHYERFQDGTTKCIEDEIPFDVPDGWVWCRFSSGFIINPRNSIQDDIKVSFIPMPLIQEGYANHHTSEIRLWKNVKTGYTHFAENDIAIAKITPCFENKKSVVFRNLLNGYGAGTTELHIIRTLENTVLPEYVLWYIKRNDFILDGINAFSGAVGQKRIGREFIEQYLIPLPPVSEQERILEAIHTTFISINNIECSHTKLNALITVAKSKILDLAIRGKLVPQDPNDEPASALLEHIQAEKEELIKQGKIKQDKKESVIFKGDDNSYYEDLPLHWSITTLRNITTPLSLNDGDWIVSDNMSANGEIKLLQLGSIGNMEYIDKGFKHITKQTFDELSCTPIMPGYLLVNRIVSDSMHCCIIPDLKGTTITTVDTCWIAPSPNMYNIKFLMYQLASPSFQKLVSMNASGTTRKRISKNNLINLPLLFPPLAEQNRIVEAIENSFEYLENIVSSAL